MRITGRDAQQKTADHSPDRVSLLHKGGYPICNSGCGDSIVEIRPSSSGQLPVPVALNAPSPTRFGNMIHHQEEKVNTFYRKEKEIVVYARRNVGLWPTQCCALRETDCHVAALCERRLLAMTVKILLSAPGIGALRNETYVIANQCAHWCGNPHPRHS